jgi:two-component system chemotaxis response regulator CheB
MPIRVLLVEDSQIALVILKRILNSSPQIEVVGEAHTGLEALSLIPKVRPDVICTDLHMPQMDGLTLTSEVMKRYPRPILVISVSVQHNDTHRVFQLLEAGAVDICPKPLAGLTSDDDRFKKELINKIEVLSGVKVLRKQSSAVKPRIRLSSKAASPLSYDSTAKPRVIAIAASTGGPQALYDVFTQLPPDFPIPIVCIQHICSGFLQGLIDWLTLSCPLSIQIAQAGAMPKPGHIYFPPERHHLELDVRGRFVYSDAPPWEGHRPSATITFTSIARVYGKRSVGIILSGMGRDGADGMLAIAEAGGVTIAQDETTSVIFGMPKEAIRLGAVQHVLPIRAIAPTLLKLTQSVDDRTKT